MAQYQDHVLLLKSRAYREADVIATGFGLKTGKFSAIVKGIRRPKSKFHGHVSPLSYSVLEIYHGRSNLDTVVGAELVKGFPRLALDLDRMGWAMILADTVDQLWADREASPETFTVLVAALDALDHVKAPATVGLAAGFHLLRVAGYGVEWQHCSACEAPLSRGPVAIDVESGEAFCPTCRAGRGGLIFISLGSLRSLQYWLAQNPRKFGQAEVKGQMQTELTELFYRFTVARAGRPLRSFDFLRHVSRLAEVSESEDKA